MKTTNFKLYLDITRILTYPRTYLKITELVEQLLHRDKETPNKNEKTSPYIVQ